MTIELAIRILSGDVLGTSEQTHEAIVMAVEALAYASVQYEKGYADGWAAAREKVNETLAILQDAFLLFAKEDKQ